MHKLLFVAILSIFAASCSQETETNNPVNNNELVPVRVHVTGFSVTKEDIPETRATQDLATYSGVKVAILAFYKSDGTEAYKTTQLKDDNTTFTTFGEFACSLPMGSYTMVVIARGDNAGDVFDLTSPTSAAYTSAHVRETLVATQEINITNTDAVDISTTLSRVIAKVQAISTDNRTDDVANIRMTFSAGGTAFNPTTGLATSNTGLSNTVGGSGSTGNTTTATSYLFLASDEQTMNVTIETLDADGAVLFSKTVNNVPLQRNKLTTLTGAMYTNTGVAGTFQVNTDWLTSNNVNF